MEAIRGDLTIAEIISKYQVSKTAIHEWKRLILENGSSIFGLKKDISPEKQVEQLHRIIGKLKVENDFLQDAWSWCSILSVLSF
jgi:transposase